MTSVIETTPERPATANGGRANEYLSRRTIAIISHPDAGKTTLTEQLLRASGAIQLAGQVAARGQRRRTQSDWMKIERQRGISVTSSVMTFEYGGATINLLDTPGHSDFSEDTYRTLTAVDAAIMVIDAARGIEKQTLKLFEICRLRDIPIITFVNKVDREGREPLDILDEIAERLAMDVTPMSWPIGMGTAFRAVAALDTGRLTLPNGETATIGLADAEALTEAGDTGLDAAFPASLETLALARSALPEFDLENYRAGHQTPVLFGSALKAISVREVLDAVVRWAPPPRLQPAEPRSIDPSDEAVAGFVFKVQANMDRQHRDRIAFVRLCSGRFNRGMKLRNMRTGKDMTVGNAMLFFAQDRQTAETAVAGDIIGIPNHGTLRVGDTLTTGAKTRVTGIPDFAPEIINRIVLTDPMKSKQLGKALRDMADEGVVQIFRPVFGSDWLVGAVGELQLQVLIARIEDEYKIPVRCEPAGIEAARWVASEVPGARERFIAANKADMVEDRAGNPVFLIRSVWSLNRIGRDWPDVKLLMTQERAA